MTSRNLRAVILSLRSRSLSLRSSIPHFRSSFALRVASCLACASATVVACGWVNMQPSVRFSSWTTERERGRLPPLPRKSREGFDGFSASARDDEETMYESEERRAAEAEKLWTDAEAATVRGDLKTTRQLLRAYLAHDGTQERRNSAADQLDALDSSASAPSVSAYLSARRAYDAWQHDPVSSTDDATPSARVAAAATDAPAHASVSHDGEGTPPAEAAGERLEDVMHRALDTATRAPALADNAAYLRAAILYRKGRMREAATAFAGVAARHPRSEKREAALYMAALVRLKMSRSFTGTSGDPLHLKEIKRTFGDDDERKRNEAAREATGEATGDATANAGTMNDSFSSVSPEENASAASPDRAWHEAREGFARVIVEYPRGRFGADARGWLAYLLLRAGNRAGALVEYYRLLADERDRRARENAVVSLRMTRHHASDEEMRRVEAELEDEPQAALVYAYHNLYNFALNPACEFVPDSLDYSDSSQWEQQRDEARRERREDAEKERIVRFATRMLRRYPRAQIGATFALRLGQANLELGRYGEAREQSRRALGSGLPREEHAQARWVKGVAEHRLGMLAEARSTLGALVAEDPRGELAEGARALVAMAAEDAGDLDAALEQYIALEYTNDIAYFIDVLMTPEQLKSFIERRPANPRRDEWLYGLAVRYMRLGRYREARAVYAQIRTENGNPYDLLTRFGCDDSGGLTDARRNGYKCADPKQPDSGDDDFARNRRGVRARWVLADLKTMDDLERLERAATHAESDEAKAEALYQLAGYLYEASDLAFYNPAAWRGTRFTSLHYDQQFRAPDEAQTMRRYMEQHEPVVRALEIYLLAARLYPQTRAARDALYTAAVCHERLAGFQLYWPRQYAEGLHAGSAMVTYADVRRIYPRYQLPRGTVGWEPRTRTVRGGAGWAAPPRPKPQTRTERLRRKIRRAEHAIAQGWQLFGEIGGGRVRRWSLVGISSFGLLLVFRLTRRTQRLLHAQLAGRRAATFDERRSTLALPVSPYSADAPDASSARVRAFSRDAASAFWRLALDGRGRTALLLNLITHGLLIVLLSMLAWALKQG